MPSVSQCVSRLRKRYKDIDKEALEQIVNDVESFQMAEKSLGGDPRLSMDEFLENRAVNLALHRKAMAENLVKSKRVFERTLLDAFKNDPVEGLLAVLGGTIRKVPGLGPSIDSMSKGIEVRYGNMLIHGLGEAGLWKVALAGNLDKEIMQEMFELKPGGKPGISGSKEAQQIAAVYHKVQDGLVHRLQSAGSTVKRMEGYIMRQSHDPHKVHAATYENWKAAIEPRLNRKMTFGEATGNIDLEDEILKDIYKQIKDDNWNLGLGQHIDDSLATILDPQRMDKRFAKSRALHFKDGAAFHEYNLEFGRSDLLSSIHGAIIKTGRSAALIETFGTNPDAGFQNLVKKLKRHYSKVDPAISDKIDVKFKRIEALFKEVKGDTRRAGKSMGAAIVRNILAVQRMRLLGKSIFTTIADISAAATTLRTLSGDNLLSAHARVISGFIANIPNKAHRVRIGQRLNIIVDDYLGSIYNRIDATDTTPGRMGELQRLFFRLNGMTAQTIIGKTSMAKIFAGDLADVSHKSFGALSDRHRLGLSKYGIGENEWGAIRHGVEDLDGVKLLTTEAVRELDDSVYKTLRGDRKISIADLREEVSSKYQSYITDAVDDAIPTPGAREESFILRGLGEDTAWGAVARLVKQFKTVPLSLHRVHGKATFGKPGATANTWSDLLNFDNLTRLDKSTDMQNMIGFMISSTLLGYMGMVGKDLVSGRNPRDPFDPETIKDALVHGGAAGLIGDLSLADYDDSHRNLQTDLLGPTFGTLGDAAKVFASARDLWQDGREGKEVVGETLKLAGRHIPGQNLFWTRLALDYMLLHGINEHLNPGYSRRFRNKISSDQGFWDVMGVKPGDPTERLGR